MAVAYITIKKVRQLSDQVGKRRELVGFDKKKKPDKNKKPKKNKK